MNFFKGKTLESVSESTLKKFPDAKISRIEYVPIISNPIIEVYVFYCADSDISKNDKLGVSEKISSFIVGELNRIGRGPTQGVLPKFVFDSHENVVINYEGSYFFRLR